MLLGMCALLVGVGALLVGVGALLLLGIVGAPLPRVTCARLLGDLPEVKKSMILKCTFTFMIFFEQRFITLTYSMVSMKQTH